ncbi:LOW QUALITY PROTEIN: Pol protein [Phytophthora palmivora]|uniref:Pol protein n=1 Tax=Phytophthora palmivora TaxID=4796 RepID=A0A2P4WY64_9STRA|nr:LOW QUALITY PROTEIN: Pol protein [Phytophthora palmivora]
MRANKHYAIIDKRVVAAGEITAFKGGARGDPGKVKVIAAWTTPTSQKDLKTWLALTSYITSTAQDTLNSLDPSCASPEAIVSDRDPCFTGGGWNTLFQLLGPKLTIPTADHPQTDRQMDLVNRTLRAEALWSWSDQLPMVEFTLNNAMRTYAGPTPFYLNMPCHPRVPLIYR